MTLVKDSGNVGINNDFIMSSGKAIRVDGSGTTDLNFGNWGSGATGVNLNVYGNILVNGNDGFDLSNEEGGINLGDSFNFIKAIHGTGVRIGVYGNDEAITIANNGIVNIDNELCLGGICKSSWGSVYVGNTVSTDNGNQGGYSVVDDLCIDGAHVCSNEEIIKSMRDGVSMSGSAWVNSGAGGSSNDCRGWTSSSSSDFGAVWDLSSKISWVVPCSASLNFACCK
jgi:hypothetical protein